MKNPQDVATRAPGTPAPQDAPRPGPEADASTRHRVAQSILEHGPSTAAALGDRLGEAKDAVQPGRRIATLRRSAGCTTAIAFMSPPPR